MMLAPRQIYCIQGRDEIPIVTRSIIFKSKVDFPSETPLDNEDASFAEFCFILFGGNNWMPSICSMSTAT